MAISEEAEEPNAHKARGQNVQEETTQELLRGQGHSFLSITASVILPEESYPVVVKC
jgi:hypothetical protein